MLRQTSTCHEDNSVDRPDQDCLRSCETASSYASKPCKGSKADGGICVNKPDITRSALSASMPRLSLAVRAEMREYLHLAARRPESAGLNQFRHRAEGKRNA